jgi:hypothetical protein
VGAAATLALIAPAAAAGQSLTAISAANPTAPTYDPLGNLVDTPFVRPEPAYVMTKEEALAAARGHPRIRDWIARYPKDELTEEATLSGTTKRWTVKIWARGEAGQIVLARVEDETGRVVEAWTGPQVAWTMARGLKGSFGKKINSPAIWYGLLAAFVVGLVDWRRLRSLRNLDVLVLVSFTASWWFFNEGEIFTSVPLAYPPLLYLLARTVWVGLRGRGTRTRAVWPVWVLLAATVFLAGFRIGLNVRASNVIDVGFASVVGAQRIVSQGEIPYGHMPTDDGKECGVANSEGYVRNRIQTNDRCETAIERGDVYGPVTYLAYVPGYLSFGWTGKWDDLPAAHMTSIVFDLLALVGMGLVGRRFGGARLGATLAFAWAAYPFTQYVQSSNSNDAIMPALLVWGFFFLTSAPARGLFVGLAGLAKFAALGLVPLWASYPTGLRRPRGVLPFAAGFALAVVLSFWMLFLEPSPVEAARAFWDRTFGYQLSRPSPFSLWNWGQYRYPDLAPLQTVGKILLVIGAVAVGFRPRTKTPLQVAALTAALLIGFEIVLTHWFYLYLPWFLPFAAFALLAPAEARPPAVEVIPPGHEVRDLVTSR